MNRPLIIDSFAGDRSIDQVEFRAREGRATAGVLLAAPNPHAPIQVLILTYDLENFAAVDFADVPTKPNLAIFGSANHRVRSSLALHENTAVYLLFGAIIAAQSNRILMSSKALTILRSSPMAESSTITREGAPSGHQLKLSALNGDVSKGVLLKASKPDAPICLLIAAQNYESFTVVCPTYTATHSHPPKTARVDHRAVPQAFCTAAQPYQF